MGTKRRRRQPRAQLALFDDEFLAAAGEPLPGPPVVREATPAPEPLQEPRPVPRARRSRAPGVSSADARAMVWLRARGESLTAIARQFHASRETVLRFWRSPLRIRELEEQEQRAQRRD